MNHNAVADLIEEVQNGHASTEELRVAMAAYLMRSFWPKLSDEERLQRAVHFLAAAKGSVVYECWAGNCIHYYRQDLGRIKAAVTVAGCPCGAKSARTPGELPKRPFPTKGRRR